LADVKIIVVDGETLYGDYVVPPGLAAVIDWAFPSRSIEGAPGSIMGPTATGRTHELTITAVALLGVDLPGVSTLAGPDGCARHVRRRGRAGAGSR
jgi:hypothetical protein